jgi:hypothetical protein
MRATTRRIKTTDDLLSTHPSPWRQQVSLLRGYTRNPDIPLFALLLLYNKSVLTHTRMGRWVKYPWVQLTRWSHKLVFSSLDPNPGLFCCHGF